MRYRYILIVIIVLSAAIFLAYQRKKRNEVRQSPESENISRYLPLGDSYTAGTGVNPENNFPKQLVKMLSDSGINVSLIDNPAQNGFTTQDLIGYELPVLNKTTPDLVTLLIGVNDWVQGVDKNVYEKNLHSIIESVQKSMGPSSENIILITIPDFGLTTQGKKFGSGRDISKGIEEFNEVIKTSGAKYGLPVADIYPVSKTVSSDSSLVASDGLHPSGKLYAEWVKIIYPLAEKALRK